VGQVIVRETESDFYLVTQHDHAQLSGVLASHFDSCFFEKDTQYDALLLAVHEHDRSWIPLDDTPIWNDKSGVPFSFRDYPLLPKLLAYKHGIDETEQMNPYAGLLCSLHYSSFFTGTADPACLVFCAEEALRQTRIKLHLSSDELANILKHLQLLQLCDELSLYVCLNDPGIEKTNEFLGYREGFKRSEMFARDRERITASWVSRDEIVLTPFPFEEAFPAQLRLKRVTKEDVKRLGIESAYKSAEWIEQRLYYGRGL
jgi:hypothetical protein